MRIAIIGSGVSGLVTAHLLRRRHDVVLYETDERPGGHAHTHRIELPELTCDVDTGFLVYNERTYPMFCRLLDELGVATKPSDMSFSVADQRAGLEWRGSSISTVFARRANLARPDFLRMLVDVARFNRLARRLVTDPPPDSVTLEEVLAPHRWSAGFRDWYLVPLGSSIWSANPSTFTRIPATTFVRFFERHGLLSLHNQPNWRTVEGGSTRYVEAIVGPLRNEGRLRLGNRVDKIRREYGGVEVMSEAGVETYDHVVLASHSDQALRLLSDADRMEHETLGALRYQSNRATLHTDSSLLPSEPRAWASWNYHRLDAERDEATLTYYLNRLQGIDSATPVLVTLNRDDAIDPEKVLAQMQYAHPVFDPAAIRAQGQRDQINGTRRTWFTGAYWGYGFHEDGVRSAVETCRALGVTW
jgi:predicted NAD/FAD-binding protein